MPTPAPTKAILDAAAQAARDTGVRITLTRGDWTVTVEPPKEEAPGLDTGHLDTVTW